VAVRVLTSSPVSLDVLGKEVEGELRVGYIPCGSPGDLISVAGETPFDIIGGPWASDGFLGSGSSREPGGFLQGVSMVWVSTCIGSATLGDLFRKRKVGHTGVQSTSPSFYRTCLSEEWYYN
jgi:hypothetical protein